MTWSPVLNPSKWVLKHTKTADHFQNCSKLIDFPLYKAKIVRNNYQIRKKRFFFVKIDPLLQCIDRVWQIWSAVFVCLSTLLDWFKTGGKSYSNLTSQNNAKAGNQQYFLVTKLVHYFKYIDKSFANMTSIGPCFMVWLK